MSAWYGLEAESTREDNKIQDDLRLFLVVEDQETNIVLSIDMSENLTHGQGSMLEMCFFARLLDRGGLIQ